MTADNLTIKGQEALQKATQLAQSRGQQAVDTAHLLQAALQTDESVTGFLLGKTGANMSAINRQLDEILNSFPKVAGGGNPYPEQRFPGGAARGGGFRQNHGRRVH